MSIIRSVFFLFFVESDFEGMEFLLTFNSTSYYQSFILEAVDDTLSEKEEWFALYLNTSNSRCAISVSIQDNDCKFNDK